MSAWVKFAPKSKFSKASSITLCTIYSIFSHNIAAMQLVILQQQQAWVEKATNNEKKHLVKDIIFQKIFPSLHIYFLGYKNIYRTLPQY